MTREEDHRRMLELLGLPSLRPGRSGTDPAVPNCANGDESLANPHPDLPDAFTSMDGSPVRSQADWERRRQELFGLFDREVFGIVPEGVPAVAWEVAEVSETTVCGVHVRQKRLVGHIPGPTPELDVNIQLELSSPLVATEPVPVILEIGYEGFEPPPPPEVPPMADWRELVLQRGWGYAILDPLSVQADDGSGLQKGIIGLMNEGRPRGLEEWGAIRAWAWAASRVLDYFESDPDVDATRVGLEGLSRFGKTTLLAMAYEPRFAVGFVGCSGQGGAKIWRRDFGEIIENLAEPRLYHWMAGRFMRYSGPLQTRDLPVDGHLLLGLCAPRPVFVGVGSIALEGIWTDATGTFMAAREASPIYEFTGARGIGTQTMPPEGTALIEGDLALCQHRYGHSNAPNWPVFLEFAERYLGR